MKLRVALALSVVGGILLAFLVPRYTAAQPRGLSLTRGEAARIADAEAAKLGIPLDRAWKVVRWDLSDHLQKELGQDVAWRRKAEADPALGPRLGFFSVTYFRLAPAEKWPAFATIEVGRHGEVLSALRFLRNEEGSGNPSEEALRTRADALVSSRVFPGAPSPVFDSVRPQTLAKRTDRVFRYKVAPTVGTGPLDVFLGVHFSGSELTGWSLFEEYKDGRRYRFESGERLAAFFARMAGIFVLLGLLFTVFIKKYHAGELGVRTAAALFAATLLLAIVQCVVNAPGDSYGTNFGALDARMTAATTGGFQFLFYSFPVSLLVFLAWAAGESRARERWGEKLASFDAIFRRDPLNATVGASILTGVLVAPALAALTFLVPLLPIALGMAHVELGSSTETILSSLGGAWGFLAVAAGATLTHAVVTLLFNLSGAAKNRRLLPLALLAVLLTSLAFTTVAPPLGPFIASVKFSAGGILGAALLLLASDLLAVTVGLFGSFLLVGFLPYLAVVVGAPRREALLALGLPLVLLLVFALVGLATKRSVVYTYEDLAPHVKRIVERERVKAEIDAANRIQSALLPAEDPEIDGATVASHYQAATEIGGDYFDFLPLGDGLLGIAFGDVSGHGLTSGIVMSMTKSALLVQVGYDPSPLRVMEVLNESVIRTAPKRILMTFFYGLLDVARGELRFSSAGHLDPYVYRAAEKRLVALSAWGFPLGVKRREPFCEFATTFEAGDRLILYSDGLIEAMGDDGEPFGFPRFESTILANGTRSAVEIKQALLQSVKRFTRNRPAEDDQTLVVIGFEEPRARLRIAS